MELTRFARPVRAEPTTWLRGVATIAGEWIVLDPARAEEYEPYGETELVFDLANIRRPPEALVFVQRYGLLRHGPGAGSFRERFADFESEALAFHGLLHLCAFLRRAVNGDAEALGWLRDVWQPHQRPMFQAAAADDGELLMQVSKVIALVISEGLNGTEQGIVSGAEWGDPPALDRFMLAARPPDLLGYAYHQVAMLLVNRVPTAPCQDCGRYFLVTDQRQRYCSKTCGNRARHRRWLENKQAGG